MEIKTIALFLLAGFATFGLLSLVDEIWDRVSAKREAKREKFCQATKERLEEMESEINSIVTRCTAAEQATVHRFQRIEDALDIDLREMDFNRIKKIEKRLDELEGRLNG